MQALSQLSYGPVTLLLSMVQSENRFAPRTKSKGMLFRIMPGPRAMGDARVTKP